MNSISPEDETETIRALDAAWGEAASRKDLEAVVDLYTEDGTLIWPGAPALTGTEAIRTAWEGFFTIPGLSLLYTSKRIDISAAGDTAIDFGDVTLGQTSESGPTVTTAKYLVAWKKVAGVWKVYYDAYNLNEE